MMMMVVVLEPKSDWATNQSLAILRACTSFKDLLVCSIKMQKRKQDSCASIVYLVTPGHVARLQSSQSCILVMIIWIRA